MATSQELTIWRQSVVERDNGVCQKCGTKPLHPHAHHIKSRSRYPCLALIVSNGQTLCKECHDPIRKPSPIRSIPESVKDFPRRLIEIQRREELTDSEMACRLDVSREWWNQVKNGKEELTSNVKLAAVKAWPELLSELAHG